MSNPIPEQFWNPEFRFIRAKPESKEPFGPSWKDNMLSYDDPVLHNWVNNNQGNVAIVAGYGRLRIVDCDGGKIPDSLASIRTTVQKTPKKGFHVFFLSDDDENFDDKFEKLEYRALDRYALIAPSVHPDTKTRYEIISKRMLIEKELCNEIQALISELEKKK